MEVDLILADIITNELQISASRVVVYNQNFDAPKDNNLYVLIKNERDKTLGTTNTYDKDTNLEKKSVSRFTYFNIEFISKNRDAYERRHEAIMALTSTYSIQQQETNQIRIFRAGDPLDISAVEGARALNRWRIPVVISNLKLKSTDISTMIINKFQQEEVLVDE